MWLPRLCIAGRADRRNSRGSFLGYLVIFGVTRFIFLGDFLLTWEAWNGMGWYGMQVLVNAVRRAAVVEYIGHSLLGLESMIVFWSKGFGREGCGVRALDGDGQ